LTGGVWTQGFTPAKQVLYHLTHASIPFNSGYFGDGGVTNYLPGVALNCDPLYISLPSSYDYRHEPLAPGEYFNSLRGTHQYCINDTMWNIRLKEVHDFDIRSYYISFKDVISLQSWVCWNNYDKKSKYLQKTNMEQEMRVVNVQYDPKIWKTMQCVLDVHISLVKQLQSFNTKLFSFNYVYYFKK
jgi:hypothetical protein